MDIAPLQDAARIGSPTAKALLAQIDAETRQAKEQREAERRQRDEAVHAAEAERIEQGRATIAAALARYDEHAQAAEAALVEVALVASTLPPGLNPWMPPHLRRAHMPPSVLKPLDPLHPVFTSVETALAARGV